MSWQSSVCMSLNLMKTKTENRNIELTSFKVTELKLCLKTKEFQASLSGKNWTFRRFREKLGAHSGKKCQKRKAALFSANTEVSFAGFPRKSLFILEGHLSVFAIASCSCGKQSRTSATRPFTTCFYGSGRCRFPRSSQKGISSHFRHSWSEWTEGYLLVYSPCFAKQRS